MTIEEQLKEEILSKYRSMKAFSDEIGVPNNTIDSALRRGIGKAGIGTMLKVFEALDLDPESIKTGTLRRKHIPTDMDPQIIDIISECKFLNAQGLEKVRAYAEDLANNSKYQKKKPSTED